MKQPSWVNWKLAESTALALLPPGPDWAASKISQLVAELRYSAELAPAVVAETAELPLQGDAAEVIVDRPGIIRANISTSQAMLKRADVLQRPEGWWQATQSSFSGLAFGTVLALVGSRILGQFDPFSEQPRLLLVAPNIALAEDELQVAPSDFRMWVCLHEQTHQVQFLAAPWLVDYLSEQINELVVAEQQERGFMERIASIRETASNELQDKRTGSLKLVSALSTPEAVAALDRVTVVMSILEGHAEIMMDKAGPAVVKTLPKIRKAFDQRRKRRSAELVTKVLGMDAKMAQYQDGAKFCRAVIGKAGLTTFNQIFTSPAYLPLLRELHEPMSWLERIDRG